MKTFHVFIFFSLLFFICSCAAPTPLMKTEPIATPVAKIAVVEPPVVMAEVTNYDDEFQRNVKPFWSDYFKEDFTDTRSLDIFIATNRNNKNNSFGCTNEQFGVNLDKTLHFGVCKINVPKNHSTGQINLTKDARQNSHDYFKILNASTIDENNLLNFLKKTKRTPLVFVHGFNVKYQDAVLRAAQIAYDLKYQGPIMLFTWPAGAGDGFFDEKMITRTYENNLKNAKESREYFKKFLLDLKDHDLKINLVVHSMGHQVVLPVLKEIGEGNLDHHIINELILNAPDFEADEFKSLITPIKTISKRVTLYCSYNDKAISASETYNKNERLGGCTYAEEIDTINVALIDALSAGLGHSYYSSRAILTDVFQVLLGLDVEKRLFIRKSEPNSTEKYYLRQ